MLKEVMEHRRLVAMQRRREAKRKTRKQKTYNTRYSLVVTDPTTDLALTGLSRGERTGSRVLQWIWSYVLASVDKQGHIPEWL